MTGRTDLSRPRRLGAGRAAAAATATTCALALLPAPAGATATNPRKGSTPIVVQAPQARAVVERNPFRISFSEVRAAGPCCARSPTGFRPR